MNKEYKTNLEKNRVAKGYTQKKLAEASGVSIRMIQKYELLERDINKAQGLTLQALAQVLDCKMEDLLELDKIKYGL